MSRGTPILPPPKPQSRSFVACEDLKLGALPGFFLIELIIQFCQQRTCSRPPLTWMLVIRIGLALRVNLSRILQK